MRLCLAVTPRDRSREKKKPPTWRHIVARLAAVQPRLLCVGYIRVVVVSRASGSFRLKLHRWRLETEPVDDR